MRNTTLVLVTIAALGLGGLVGLGVVDSARAVDPQATAEQPMALSTDGAPVFRYFGPDDVPAGRVEANPGQPVAVGENVVARNTEWQSKILKIELTGDSRVEYKNFMAQGDTVLFNWSVDGEEVYFDFHAHDRAFGEEFFTRYEEGFGSRRSGVFVAPYAGQHGWYWQNLEPDAETVTLEVAGFFEKIERIVPNKD